MTLNEFVNICLSGGMKLDSEIEYIDISGMDRPDDINIEESEAVHSAGYHSEWKIWS